MNILVEKLLLDTMEKGKSLSSEFYYKFGKAGHILMACIRSVVVLSLTFLRYLNRLRLTDQKVAKMWLYSIRDVSFCEFGYSNGLIWEFEIRPVDEKK